MINLRKLGCILLGVGVAITVFALISDYIGFGETGIQAAQLFIIQLGVLLSVVSVGLLLSSSEIKISSLINQIITRILSLPPSSWILIGFTIAYVLLFVIPVFFNSDRRIFYLTRYVPEMHPIGHDLTFNTSGIENLFSGKGLYDLENHYYPPLYAVIFSPFLLLEYPDTYFVMTGITLFCTVVSGLILPSLIMRNKDRATLLFFFITVIFSYGMQFELERGQFNIFAFTLSFFAVYIFHRHYQFRHLAYLLLSVAVQIKLFPVIFTLMLVKDWRGWKENILRFAGLAIFNIALLFVLGYQVFIDFTKAIPVLLNSVWIRPYNHSLESFVNDLTSSGLGLFQLDTISRLEENHSFIKFALIAYYLVCLMIVIGRAYKNNENDINFDLFLVCTIGAMILPSVSIDYKLPLLSPAIALALSYSSQNHLKLQQVASAMLLVIISLSYSYTLFSFVYQPVFLTSSFPLLMLVLTAITLLNIIENRTFFRYEEKKRIEMFCIFI